MPSFMRSSELEDPLDDSGACCGGACEAGNVGASACGVASGAR